VWYSSQHWRGHGKTWAVAVVNHRPGRSTCISACGLWPTPTVTGRRFRILFPRAKSGSCVLQHFLCIITCYNNSVNCISGNGIML
jgi:hypothetical protein